MENQGMGMLACDEALFERVWSRVAGAPPEELCPAEGEPPEPAPQETLAARPSSPPAVLSPAPLPAVDPTCAALQRWIFRLLNDGEAYRALARRTRRGREELSALGREKHGQARTLGAEYFLRTGVRYWPQNTLQPLPALPFFPFLRMLYAMERDRESALRAQAAQEEPELANRYLALADACRAAAHRLRALLESAW